MDLACCGLHCEECPVYLASAGEDIAGRDRLADSASCGDAASHCHRLHQMLTTLPRYTWERIGEVSFRNGIYLVFEAGETYRGMPRIVRVGTHTSPNRLRQRLRDHFIRENHNGSIFRKNIGKALLHQTGDPYLATWSLDTSRLPYKGMENPHREREVEQAVSRYLRRHMTFSVFEVETREQRLRLEEGIIASLHQAEDFQASKSWLGRFSPEKEIRESGMWLKRGLDGVPLTDEELKALECRLAVSCCCPGASGLLGQSSRTGRAEGRDSRDCLLHSPNACPASSEE